MATTSSSYPQSAKNLVILRSNVSELMVAIHGVSPEFADCAVDRMDEVELRSRITRYREMRAVNAIRAVAAESPDSALLLSSHGRVVEIDCASLARVSSLRDVEDLIRVAARR